MNIYSTPVKRNTADSGAAPPGAPVKKRPCNDGELKLSCARVLDFKRDKAFEVLADKKKNSFLHKKFCKNIIKYGKCGVEGCGFAHSLSEFNPSCIFEDSCRYKGIGCNFLHPGESFEEYCNIHLNLSNVGQKYEIKEYTDDKKYTICEIPQDLSIAESMVRLALKKNNNLIIKFK